MTKEHIERTWPGLAQSGYTVTSPVSLDYNCIAWAAGDTSAWWDPDTDYYWPTEAPREYTLAAYVKAYETMGYCVCRDGSLEAGFEKVAIYVDASGTPTHTARQLPSGQWTSKLGDLEDIEHPSLEGLAGAFYGDIRIILKRMTAR